MIFRLAVFGLVAALWTSAFCLPTMAQTDRDQTLADIRQELSVLFVEIQKLRRELSTTGAPSTLPEGSSILSRVDGIEAELQRLTAKTEELEFRIDRIVRDGTNRIGDLEFRLVELGGGDLASLGPTEPLGGADDSNTATGAPLIDGQNAGPELAVGEQARFDAARAALDEGDAARAAELLEAYIVDYPGGGLIGAAHFYRGEALSELGQTAPAARSYLDSFSANPEAATAPLALYSLGLRLADLDQTQEACVTLAEVQVRFPDSDVAFDAGAERRVLGCS